jgi:hypothetical protein
MTRVGAEQIGSPRPSLRQVVERDAYLLQSWSPAKVSLIRT